MTETAWLACTDPETILLFLRDKAGDRKLRLFACAAVRRFWHELDDPWSRKVVAVALEAADDEARHGELGSLDRVARRAAESSEYRNTARAVADLTLSNPWHAAIALARRHAQDGSPLTRVLAADIFGNPFRAVVANPAWLTPTVVALAQVTYEEPAMPSWELDPDRLAILADAVEEAGCNDVVLLGHLRAPWPHVRGCWAVDLVLGKQQRILGDLPCSPS